MESPGWNVYTAFMNADQCSAEFKDFGDCFGRGCQPISRPIRKIGYWATGLGLAISKMIVEAHHGRFRVTSELGKGSRFEFRMPRRQPDQLLKR